MNDNKKLFGKYHDLVLIVIGFILTSIAGGFITFVYQRNSWEYQNKKIQIQSERKAPTTIFQEISRLMDKRLYRLRQFYWKAKRSKYDSKVVEEQINKYREVLYEWNESLNRNLALVQRYFGEQLRYRLEDDIYREFMLIGGQVEIIYSTRKKDKNVDPKEFELIEAKIDALNRKVYLVNVAMIKKIQEGQIGVFSRKEMTNLTNAMLVPR